MSDTKSIEQLAIEAFEQGVDSVVALAIQLASKRKYVKKDSSNSGMAPSSDLGKKKRPNSRKPSEKKQGGQPGHKGSTLDKVSDPDVIIDCKPSDCGCGHFFNGNEEFDGVSSRQVFDIPEPKVVVTEYVVKNYLCPYCGQIHSGEFPEDISAPTQYGDSIKAHIIYMMNYQMLPYKRTAEMFQNLFGMNISEGTLRNIQHKFYNIIEEPVEAIKNHIINSNIIHADETGLYAEGNRQWLHVASTDLFTHYFTHKKRGKEAMDFGGILPEFEGQVIHDYWSSYYSYTKCNHGLCNSHHLRDLQYIIDLEKHEWAGEMKQFLSDSKKVVDSEKENGSTELSESKLKELTEIYNGIIERGYKEIPQPPQKKKGVRGRQAKGKSRNLLDRFYEKPEQVIGFIYDFEIPFDNNLAERDIRMMKVKQKISGTFRSTEMAEAFCATRSYISTAIKQKVNVFSAIKDAFQGFFFV